MLTWLTSNLAAISAFGAAIAFAWSAVQFILVRRHEQRTHEFDAYHRLIKELVQPDPASQSTWIDRQVAVLFELRNFPRYYPVTVRILNNLRGKFATDPKFCWPYLLAELDLTLQYIGEGSNNSLKPKSLRDSA